MPAIITRATLLSGLVTCAAAQAGEPCVLEWSDQFAAAGVDGMVTELFVFDEDGEGKAHQPSLHVAGMFGSAGGLNTPNIARFDGAAWHAMGDGLGAFVNSLGVFDFGQGERLVAAGMYDLIEDYQLVMWNGAAWESGPMGLPIAWLAGTGVFNGDLFVSGPIVAPGISYYLRWTGSEWVGVGGGLASVVWDQKVFDDGSGPAMIVAGSPLVLGFQPFVATLGIAKWTGSEWQSLGSGINGEGRAMAIFDDGDGEALYVGGNFLLAGGQSASRVARWRDGQWSAVGAGLNNRVLSLAVFDDGSGSGPALYVGGEFTMSGATRVNHLAKWNGTTWEQVGGGVNGVVHVLGVFDEDAPGPGNNPASLYVGGEFTMAGGVTSINIARWGVAKGCVVQCAGDANASGGINIDDLLMVIGAWGAAGVPGSVSGDVTGDGAVNIDDLLLIIGAWGPC